MNDQISRLSKEYAAAQRVAEESQKAAQVSEERANAAEAAQRAVMVHLPYSLSLSLCLTNLIFTTERN
jgi:hypothetical protein